MLYTSTGILRYSHGDSYSLRAEIEQSISDYYRALMPRWIVSNRQAYHAHVSVVRNEVPPDVNAWRRYEGDEIQFAYDSTIYSSPTYLWLNVFCKRLEEIREELGLPVHSPYTLPPEGFNHCFHCTLGNFKRLVQE